MSASAHVDGWPTDSGPLHVLHSIGLLQDLGRRPVWIHWPKTITDSSGAITYRGSAQFLNALGLRSLAALTLEGWLVTVKPTDDTRGLEVIIRRAR